MIGLLFSWLLTGAGDPSVMLAQGKIESDFTPTAVSRAKGGLWCGVFQSTATSESDCVALRDPFVAVARYRSELRSWLAATHGDLRAALRGYGCNWKASRMGGHCRGYDDRVVALARRLRLARLHAAADAMARRVGS